MKCIGEPWRSSKSDTLLTGAAPASFTRPKAIIIQAFLLKPPMRPRMCLIRDDENAPYRVLSPCGICQERLRYWGEDVQVAVTTDEDKIRFVELRELQPCHWTKAYPADELERWKE